MPAVPSSCPPTMKVLCARASFPPPPGQHSLMLWQILLASCCALSTESGQMFMSKIWVPGNNLFPEALPRPGKQMRSVLYEGQDWAARGWQDCFGCVCLPQQDLPSPKADTHFALDTVCALKQSVWALLCVQGLERRFWLAFGTALVPVSGYMSTLGRGLNAIHLLWICDAWKFVYS